MSAIWGKVCFNQEIINSSIYAMENKYRSFCKIDRFETVHDNTVYMGCGIQYITEEARLEKLPFYDDKNNFYLVADCLLNNREMLIDELNLDSDIPDGTIIANAFRVWGIDCVKRLEGMFAIAIYSAEKNVLYLATDPISSRCLYYCVKDNYCIFSTLLEPIVDVTNNTEINLNYMKDFLIAPGLLPQISATETPYNEIFKIRPGRYLEIHEKGICEVQYFTLKKKSTPKMPAEAWGKQFRMVFEECVKECLRTNGEVAIAMSSGFDSASVGALASDYMKKENKKLMAYTYVPHLEVTKERENDIVNEKEDVLKIVEMHPNIVPHFLDNNGDSCLEYLDEGMKIMEIPYKAFVNLPNLMEIYRCASQNGAKIVLTGQFGNSTISNGKIDDVLYDMHCKKKYLKLLWTLNKYSKKVKEKRLEAIINCRKLFKNEDKVKREGGELLLENPFVSENICDGYPAYNRLVENEFLFLARNLTDEELYKKTMCLPSMLTYLGEMETKMGLRYGIVIRDPTRDPNMMQFCYDIPYELYAYKGVPRWLIRGNMKDMLPQSILDNWLRYGVQNKDWLSRLKTNSSATISVLGDISGENPLIDYEQYRTFMDVFQNEPDKVTPGLTLNIIFVLIVYKYMNAKRKN